jgi:5-methylcytosine-specific restriction protein A
MGVPRTCVEPGCPELVERGRCSAHRLRVVGRDGRERERPSAQERGYDARWQRARAAFLQAHPFCAHHELQGQAVEAKVVDHIIPHRGDRALFWAAADNWQSLCGPCHARKSGREARGGRCGHRAPRKVILGRPTCVLCGRTPRSSGARK